MHFFFYVGKILKLERVHGYEKYVKKKEFGNNIYLHMIWKVQNVNFVSKIFKRYVARI